MNHSSMKECNSGTLSQLIMKTTSTGQEDGIGVSSVRVKEGTALSNFMERVDNSSKKQKYKAL